MEFYWLIIFIPGLDILKFRRSVVTLPALFQSKYSSLALLKQGQQNPGKPWTFFEFSCLTQKGVLSYLWYPIGVWKAKLSGIY